MTVVFLCSLTFVFLKAFQSRNVVLDRDRWVMPTAALIACAEVGMLVAIIEDPGLWAILPVALGGGLGALLAMRVHRRLFK